MIAITDLEENVVYGVYVSEEVFRAYHNLTEEEAAQVKIKKDLTSVQLMKYPWEE